MIEYETFGEIDQESPEGQLLLAALAILTSINIKDLKCNIYGSTSHPDEVFNNVLILANKIYHLEEYNLSLKSNERNVKIDSIINNKDNGI